MSIQNNSVDDILTKELANTLSTVPMTFANLNKGNPISQDVINAANLMSISPSSKPVADINKKTKNLLFLCNIIYVNEKIIKSDIVKGGLLMHFDPIEDLFNDLGVQFQSFGNDTETFFNNFGDNISSEFEVFTKDLNTNFQYFNNDASNVFNDLGKEFQSLCNEISEGFQTFVHNFETAFKDFGNNIESFYNGITSFFLGIENLIKIMPYAIGGVIGSVIAFKISKERKSMLKNERIRKIYKICKNQELNNDIKNVNFDKLKPVVNNKKLTTSKSKKFTKKN